MTSTLSCLFDGADEFVDIGDVAALSFERTNPFSISLWAKWSYSGGAILMSKVGVGGAYKGWQFSAQSGQVQMYLISSISAVNYILVRTVSTLHNSTWRHIVMTYDGSSIAAGIKIYVDGSPGALTTVSDTLSATILGTDTAKIARSTDGTGTPWNGYLDEVAVYDKELSAAEVFTLHGGTDRRPVDHATIGPTANLVGYWRMGEGATFPTIPDDSANSNDGTMTNMEAGDIQGDVPPPHAFSMGVLGIASGMLPVAAAATEQGLALPGFTGGGSAVTTRFYKMRALADPGPGYVFWAADFADFAGSLAPAGQPIKAGTATVAAVVSQD